MDLDLDQFEASANGRGDNAFNAHHSCVDCGKKAIEWYLIESLIGIIPADIE